VAELVDALVSGTSGRKVVEVRVLSWAVDRDCEAAVREMYDGLFLCIEVRRFPGLLTLFRMRNVR
jgi:hypothetical protein